MRNLIRFILKHQNFFLFILLEGIAISFLVNHNAYHSASFFNTSSRISGGMQEQLNNVTHYFELKGENTRLQEENARLKSILYNTIIVDSMTIPVLPDTTTLFTFIPARIIRTSTSNRANYAVINIGSGDSVKAGMGVISNRGVVGVVKSTSDRFAVVMPIINHNYRVSSKILGSNYFGSLSWDGVNYRKAQLNAIEKHVRIQIGDSIVTTGFSSTFPEGIPVGTIDAFNSDPNEDFYSIDINIATDFKTVSSVYIIKMKHNEELNELIDTELDD